MNFSALKPFDKINMDPSSPYEGVSGKRGQVMFLIKWNFACCY